MRKFTVTGMGTEWMVLVGEYGIYVRRTDSSLSHLSAEFRLDMCNRITKYVTIPGISAVLYMKLIAEECSGKRIEIYAKPY